MDVCRSCLGQILSDEQSISCSGLTCGHRFHPRCENLTETNVASWLQGVGLLWFCSSCRIGFLPMSNPSADSEGEQPEVKKARIDSLPTLPPEIWILIFKQLSPYWLKKVRLTCQAWKQIVSGCPKLMGKFVITINMDSGRNEHARKLLETGGGFTRACLTLKSVTKQESWLKPLGETLHTMECNNMTNLAVIRLLKHMPNLKNFTFGNCSQNRSVEPDFQLQKLEQLTLNDIRNSKTLNAFKLISPRLKKLKLRNRYQLDADYDKELVSFIHSTRNTLQEISLAASSNVLNGIVRIENLHLTRITIECSESGVLLLIRHQSKVEFLDLSEIELAKSSLIFHELHERLPNLKGLKIWVIERELFPPQFRQHCLGQLELFSIKNRDQYQTSSLDLKDCCFSRLSHIELHFTHLSAEVPARQLIATSLTSVVLMKCSFNRASDILLWPQLATSLQHFKLVDPNIREFRSVVPDVERVEHSHLRRLILSGVSTSMLLAFMRLCPSIESLALFSINDITLFDIHLMNFRLKRLKELKFSSCRFTLDSLKLLTSSFNTLETISMKSNSIDSQTAIRNAFHDMMKDVEVYLS